MTACAIEPPSTGGADGAPGTAFAVTADGAYAARLASAGEAWFPERWTLDGPEPYAVPLPGNQPEEPGTEVQPLSDGRVLIHRLVGGRHAFALLYPTGPGTGELPLGAVECPEPGTRLTLLPPAPGGTRAYALAVGPRSSAVWLVAGGAFGPERVAEVPGRCSGGVWLDRAGRLLAVDRELDGPVKTVVVDLARGEVSPLLQIAADSDDRLLLADPDSGLLLISSDAPSPGRERLGWGVLGSTLPVRFPESLRVPDCTVTPFAIQPGQALMPEHCAVALRVEGLFGNRVGTWRPAGRRLNCWAAPKGWLPGTGLWTRAGTLRLPYSTEDTPCGVANLTPPAREPAAPFAATPAGSPAGRDHPAPDDTSAGPRGTSHQPAQPSPPVGAQAPAPARPAGARGSAGAVEPAGTGEPAEPRGSAGAREPAGARESAEARGSAGLAEAAARSMEPAGPAKPTGAAGAAEAMGPVSTIGAMGPAGPSAVGPAGSMWLADPAGSGWAARTTEPAGPEEPTGAAGAAEGSELSRGATGGMGPTGTSEAAEPMWFVEAAEPGAGSGGATPQDGATAGDGAGVVGRAAVRPVPLREAPLGGLVTN